MTTADEVPERQKVNPQNWIDILEKMRELHAAGTTEFTSSDLAQAAGLKGTQERIQVSGSKSVTRGASAQQHAAGWISKFRKWGYLKIVGQQARSGYQPSNLYSLTKSGLTIEHTLSHKAKLTKLCKAVRDYLKAPAGKAASSALGVLQKMLDDVEPKEASQGRPE